MAEIDPVIFEFVARQNKFLADIRSTTKTVDQQLGLQEAKVRRLESEFRRSSGQISGTLKGLAASFAAAFTGRELIGLLDSFTRLQNELKVAGLEGKALGDVQERLFTIATQNG
ncbi:MAG: hypothetical protein KKD08_08715, partial [Alphaproteobacteria bacterium]|nr:hypothetical protein [Alphaproteobacteria bacterium]